MDIVTKVIDGISDFISSGGEKLKEMARRPMEGAAEIAAGVAPEPNCVDITPLAKVMGQDIMKPLPIGNGIEARSYFERAATGDLSELDMRTAAATVALSRKDIAKSAATDKGIVGPESLAKTAFDICRQTQMKASGGAHPVISRRSPAFRNAL